MIWFRFAAMMIAALGLTSASSFAQESPSKAKTDDAKRRGELVESLVTASRLIAFGKGDLGELTGLKDYQSPEALVSAAGILLRVQKEAGGFDVVDVKGEIVKDAKDQPKLGEQAKDLFKEARNLVKGNKAREKEIEELISLAEKVDEKRGAVGKPRSITKVLAPGQSVDITIGFVPSSPATVGYTTDGGPKQRCEILSPNGTTLYDNTGKDGTHSWKTAADDKKRMITIRLTNSGVKTHTITVTTN